MLEIQNENLVRTIRTSMQNFHYGIDESSLGEFNDGNKRSLIMFIKQYVLKIDKLWVYFDKGDWKNGEIEKLLEITQSVDEVC